LLNVSDHKGGPDGGDGGIGGDVVFFADDNYSQLSHLKHSYRASSGSNGAKKNRHGKNGSNLVVKVEKIAFYSCHLYYCRRYVISK